MDEINYHLPVFEGPLDLLLSLISKNKVDISDIPIALIFDQYMEYINMAQAVNMELAGDFIVMAAELMLIKSKMLLPAPEKTEEDPRASLAAVLMEYSRIKAAAEMLNDYYTESGGRVAKEPESLEKDTSYVADDSIARLERAFRSVLSGKFGKNSDTDKLRPEKMLGQLLSRGGRRIPVPVKIYGIMRRLYKCGDCSFQSLLLDGNDRAEIITIFVAVLELLRSQRVSIVNEENDNLTLHLYAS